MADRAGINAVENNYLTIREQINYAGEMTECGKDGHKCKNDTRKKYKAIYDKNQQEKITELERELSKPAFLRNKYKTKQEIRSVINLIKNRPFRGEVTRIPEQRLNGVEIISPERYVPRVEIETIEDAKAIGDFGLSIYPPTAFYYNAAKFIDGGIEDYTNGNFDNTKNNIIRKIVPKAMEKITKITKTRKEIITTVIEVLKLGDELNNE